ncbi:proton-conducting transporter membrane subunit [Alteromonas ponticola]|uniref:Monovalent cation/H+ antiporter subunit D family protein n=1 Tax=Alteromonas ponticola TaxID=2720613 RepID=A0ABX1R249_9ALTE|nr:proton-conducting transporter membrane subunit [Alteromonas ponticola]NMH60529.1 monovalent cation/H+ antiporter subunit D family protein [Alteromonas ponticola]
MTDHMLMLLTFLLPTLGAIIISRLDNHPNVRELVTIATATSLFVVVLNLYLNFEGAEAQPWTLAEPVEGLAVTFVINRLGLMFALIASSLWLVTSIYAIGYMRTHQEQNQTRFYVLFAVAIAAVMAIAFSDNLFTLFLFYEVLTLSTYPLVTHKGNEKSRRSGRVYLGILMGTSIGLFLFGILIVWQLSGNLTFTEGGVLQGHISSGWVAGLYLLFLFGIGKAAVMPIHRWLPAAMVAPTPVSALLHAVAVVKAGVFALLKVTLFIFGPELLQGSFWYQWLIFLPLLTILLASLVALTRDNLKERLAYSTISQLSYIVLGIMMVNSIGMFGGALHIAMHAFAKISLFFAAGAILITAHKTKISELAGLGRQMPFTFGVFLIGTLSIIGLPPLAGFWSKWYLIMGGIEFTGAEVIRWSIVITLLISSLLNIYYLGIIPLKAYFGTSLEPEPKHGIKEAPLPCLVGLAIPAALCIYLFFHPEPFYSLAQQGTVTELEAGASGVQN